MALTSFADVQNFLTNFCQDNGIGIATAKHGPFWNTTYKGFVNGNVPNVVDPNTNQPLPILNKINGKYDAPSSNIVMALAGAGSLFDTTRGRPSVKCHKEGLICPTIRSRKSRAG